MGVFFLFTFPVELTQPAVEAAMIELVMTLCLAAQPTKCRDEAMTIADESVTPLQCLMGAPPVIAQYMERRPRWVCRRWRCRPAGMVREI